MRIRVVHTTALIVAALFGLPAAAQDRTYYCGDGQGVISVSVLSSGEIATSVYVEGSADGAFDMSLTADSTSRTDYSFRNGEYLMRFTGNTQDVLIYSAPDFGEIFCTWSDAGAGAAPTLFSTDQMSTDDGAAANLPIAGVSCGGKVRSEPQMDSRQVGSLQNGDGITILEYAGEMNGYSWFKIRFGSRTGYQWGGILSGADGELPGAFVGC